MADTKTFAFEIGSEEIPAFDLVQATEQMKTLVPDLLDKAGIEHGDIEIYSTPRRQIFIAKDVAVCTQAISEKFRGPTLKIALDDSGNPTAALLGFASSKGVEIEDLIREGEGDKEAFYAIVNTPPKDVGELLPQVCLDVIGGIKWKKSMKWGSTSQVYSRPIRWLCAMFGDQTIEFDYANITSCNSTVGHRFLSPGPHEVASADELISTIESAYVITTHEQRREIILEKIKEIEQQTGLVARIPDGTLVEVTNLTEYPTPMIGSFDEEFLKVPEEIIVDAMLMHQRYFPLYDKGGHLSNKFIITSNADPENESIIVEGNERVVAARLYDAKFFYEEDLKVPLSDNVEKLSQIIYQEKLGTILDKNNRNVKLAEKICELANIKGQDAEDAKRAAYLAKADLPTNAVIEFTSVQGIMGGYYASASGENESVARAISEHYSPKFAGDDVPSEVPGKIVSLSDKLDSVVSLIAVGEKPTGSKDPFGIRRAALGVISIMKAGLDFRLESAIDDAIEILGEQICDIDKVETKRSTVDFFVARAKKMSRDAGCEADTVEAVVASGVVEPLSIIERCLYLESARSEQRDVFDALASSFKRAKNLSDKSVGGSLDEALFGDEEKELYSAIQSTRASIEKYMNSDFKALIQELSKLKDPIDKFFESVMIMDKDEDVRRNRIALLNRFIELFGNTADFSKFN